MFSFSCFKTERRSKTPNILQSTNNNIYSSSSPGVTMPNPAGTRSSANLTSLNNHYQPQLRSKTPTTDRMLFQHSRPLSPTNDYIYLNGQQQQQQQTARNAAVDIEHHIPIYDATAHMQHQRAMQHHQQQAHANYTNASHSVHYMAAPPQSRSKTPGPDMCYFRNANPSNEFQTASSAGNSISMANGYNGSSAIRSKTPTAEMYYSSNGHAAANHKTLRMMHDGHNISNGGGGVSDVSSSQFQMAPYDIDDLIALVLSNDQVSLITDVDGNYFLEMVIDLARQETGFGFRIIGGEEEGSQVSVGHIVMTGSAHIDGRLKSNDEIIMIDNECVLGSTHRRVVQLMTIAGLNRRVKLMIRRKLNFQQYKVLLNTQQQQLKSRYVASLNSSSNNNNIIISGNGSMNGSSLASNGSPNINSTSYPYTVTLFRNSNEGFGFVIISTLHKNGPSIGTY